MKKQLLLLFMLCTSLLLVGCGGKTTVQNGVNGPSPVVKKETGPIKLGVITPLSGPAATYGSDVMQGYSVALEEINANGGIDGRQVELIVEDGKCSGKDATSAMQKLVNIDKVVAVLGGTCSSETIPTGKIAQEQGIPMISPTASSPEISSIGNYVFRYWNDADAGKVMLAHLKDMEAKNIGLIYEGNDYSAAYADVVRTGFDGEFSIDTKFHSEEKDFTILAKEVAENLENLDALVYIPLSEPNAVAFIKALMNEGIWGDVKEKFIGTETLLTEGTIEEFGENVEGVVGVRFPTIDAFGEKAVEATNKVTEGYEVQTADVFVLFAADSLYLMAEAIEKVGTDGAAIQKYLAGVDAKNPRNDYIPGFYFNEYGDGQGIPFALVEVKDGEMVTME